MSIDGLSATAMLALTETDQGAAKLTLADTIGTPTILGQAARSDLSSNAVTIVGTDPVGSTVTTSDVTSPAAPTVVATAQDLGNGTWSAILNRVA